MSGEQQKQAIGRSVTEKLRDGQVVLIRPISKDDLELERDFTEKLSPESRRLRFLGAIGKPSEKFLKQLTDVDHQHHEAFIAMVEAVSGQREVGVSRYVMDADGKAAECAVVVADDFQKKGLGTLLINRLIESARSRGVERLYSIDSAENFKIREVARAIGFDCRTDPDDHTLVIYSLDLAAQ